MAECFEDGGPQAAASVSYFALFSLFPLAIVTVAVYGLFLGGEEARQRVVEFVLDRVPLDRVEGSRDLRQALSSVTGNATAFGLVGMATLIVSASSLMGAIRGAVNAAWDASDLRPPLLGWLLDVALVLGLGLVVTLPTGLTFLTRLVVSAGGELQDALGLAGSGLSRVLLTLGQVTPVLVSFAVFAFLYRVIASADVRLRDVWPGGAAGCARVRAREGRLFVLPGALRTLRRRLRVPRHGRRVPGLRIPRRVT